MKVSVPTLYSNSVAGEECQGMSQDRESIIMMIMIIMKLKYTRCGAYSP